MSGNIGLYSLGRRGATFNEVRDGACSLALLQRHPAQLSGSCQNEVLVIKTSQKCPSPYWQSALSGCTARIGPEVEDENRPANVTCASSACDGPEHRHGGTC